MTDVRQKCVDGQATSWTQVLVGTSQKSLLGPVLFLIIPTTKHRQNTFLKGNINTKAFSSATRFQWNSVSLVLN